jgi:hypothetical protein
VCESERIREGTGDRPGISAALFAEPEPDRTVMKAGGEVLNAAYNGTFEDFKMATDGCITETGWEHKNKVSTLVTGNFQSFTDIYVPAA